MPGVSWRGEALRRSATEAPRGQPRPSTSSQERRRLVAPLRSRSFSNLEFDRDHDAEDGSGDGRKRQPQQQERRHLQQDQHRPRDQHHHPSYRPRVVDIGCGGFGVGFSGWSNSSYYRLPESRLRLTIVKLDCSSFDVQVMKSASVSELKLAVEEIFTRSPRTEGEISWSHVWGHFCLCYNNQKLIVDKAPLKTFGIKDGDELHFIRHVSGNYIPIKRRSKRRGGDHEQRNV